MWSSGAHNYVIFVGLLGLGAYMYIWADVGPAGLVVGTLAILVAVFFCWVRVGIDEQVVQIGFGPLGWPRKIVSVDTVAQASTQHVQPLRYGGWGYRLCGDGCRAIVVRRGDALKLTMNDDKILLVTVDRAEEAAVLINDRNRRGHQGSNT